MSWTVVRGIYKKGVVEPLELAPRREGVEVLVLFPAADQSPAESRGTWHRIKQDLAREMPELAGMSADQRREEFERLSRIAAERMPYRSVEEFERAMRGDEYDLAGH
jgi:hypothetical protein